MSDKEFKTKIFSDGGNHDVTLNIEDYKAAEKMNKTLPQYLATKYPVSNVETHGSAFTQMLANAGMFTKSDRDLGITPPTMAEVLDGSIQVDMNAVTRPDGQNALSPSGRFLFPALILEMVESELRRDDAVYAGVFNRMVSTTVSTPTPRYDQPVIDVTAPRTSKSQNIAQFAEPDRMVSISLSDRSFRMPTKSIGLEISKEAQAASTLDLVGIAVREQALEERADMIDQSINDMVMGNLDMGPSAQSALAVNSALTGASAGAISHAAWINFLRSQWRYRNIDWIITDLDGFLAIEGRSGRPNVQGDVNTDTRLNTIPSAANAGIGDNVNIFIIDDATIIGGASHMVGIDSSKAIRKVVYTGADYTAVEEFVMRKSTAFRFDWSERHERVGFDNAWDVVDFS